MTRGGIWRGVRRLMATLGIGCAIAASAPVSADAPFPLPFPAGSNWEIVAGYNTATHAGDDPYAIDLVRLDAPTAGTAVIAPTAGTVSWIGTDCLTLPTSLAWVSSCAIWTQTRCCAPAKLSRRDTCWEPLRPLVPQATGGLAHLHLAVHETQGDGQIQRTVPFTGPYTIEGGGSGRD